ncbi:MAG: hypothetical protein JST68_05105 [Bacteroidetes bacterium]|nr:hypothetical protein [Bacteroidota bacterium]
MRLKIPVYAHCCLLLLWSGRLLSQPIRIHFEKDTVTIRNGHTFSNWLKIKNTSSTQQSLQLVTEIKNNYLPLPDTITLTPGEERTIPLKFLASAALIKEAIQAFSLSYRTAENRTTENTITATFYTHLHEDVPITLQLLNPSLLLDPASNQAQLSFYINNESLITHTISVRLQSYPEGLEAPNDRQPIPLAPGSRKLLTYTLHNRLRRSTATDFFLTAQLLDDSGRILVTGDIRVQTLASSKQVSTPNGMTGSPQSNLFELNYVNQNNNLSYLQLRARAGTGFPDSSRLDYRLNLEYYLQPPNGVNIYDTWLSYQGQHFSIKAGSLTDNLDYAINGNGVQATAILDKDKRNSFDLFGVKNTYLLYSKLFNTLPGADIAAGRYNFDTKPFHLQASILHASDPLLNVYTNLFHTAARLQLAEKQTLQWEAGLSSEQPRDRPGNHYGYSLGARYHAELKHWSLSLNDYYSSAYYSGYQRGALNLENEITYNNQFFARYSKNHNSPKYTPTNDSLIFAPFNYNNTNVYETGWHTHIGKLTTTLHPYYMDQRLYSALSTQKSTLHSASNRIALDLTLPHRSGVFFTSADLGWTASDSTNYSQHYSSLRITGNFIARYWSFNWLTQWRPYYLIDHLQAANPQNPQNPANPGNPDNFRLYSFGPSLHFALAANRIDFSAGYFANYYSTVGFWTHTLNSQLNIGLKNNWALNGQLYYTFYRTTGQSFPDNRQLRVGIQKRFTAGRPPGTVRLRLLVFEDANSNGQEDEGEKIASRVIVRLDGAAVLTDSRGHAEFDGLDRGNHRLAIENGLEWNLSAPLTLPLIHDQTIHVPLVRSGRLNGRVLIARQKYENTEPDKEGIKVEAHGRNGASYSTYTDEKGEFHFYLPVMDYEISVQAIPAAGTTSSSGAPTQKVSVTAGAPAETQFRMEDRRRKIEVKQF